MFCVLVLAGRLLVIAAAASTAICRIFTNLVHVFAE